MPNSLLPPPAGDFLFEFQVDVDTSALPGGYVGPWVAADHVTTPRVAATFNNPSVPAIVLEEAIHGDNTSMLWPLRSQVIGTEGGPRSVFAERPITGRYVRIRTGQPPTPITSYSLVVAARSI